MRDLAQREGDRLEAADALAGGVRSFLSSLPYMAPEVIQLQAQTKLAEPLAEWERVDGA